MIPILRNLMTVALRNLNRSRFYAAINVFGLTFGITACIIILLYVRYELSFDRFNVNADRIFRVDWDLKFGSNSSHRAAVTPPMAEALKRDYPEIEAVTRFRYVGASQFKREEENTVEWRMIYTDNEIFEIFTLPFLAGNPKVALTEPYTMVITEACARQFFGDENPVGKTLIQNNTTAYKITGVVKDLPENSHFHYRMFLSLEGLPESKNGNWIGGPYNTYVLLRQGSDPLLLEKKIQTLVTNYLIPQASAVLGSAFMEEFTSGGNSLTLHLFPLLDIHLHSNLENELEGNSDIDYVYLLSIIAGFILLIACINFMNLSTARSVKRGREVGIRKVLGSTRRKLALQFLAESTLLSFVAAVLAIALTALVLPMFNLATDLNLTLPTGGFVIWLIVITTMVAGVVSGLYPGFVLSGYQAAKVLKGVPAKGNGAAFRSSLVVFQFAISITLIIATFALHEQMSFIRNRKLGFRKEQVILLHDVYNAGDKLNAFRTQMLQHPAIVDGTISSYFPGPGSARQTPLFWKFGAEPTPENSVNMERWLTDYDYIPTLGIELVQGRNFSRDFLSDSSAVIINETAARHFGFGDDVIGQKISMFHENADGSQDRNRVETSTIIGVVKDFHFESLRENVSALGLFFGRSASFIAFRYSSGNTDDVVDALRTQWKATAPGEPFYFSFLDQKFDQFYRTEEKLGQLFIVFSGLAIIIACLGLFALTAFTAEQRVREIGIRKVMGATEKDVVFLLSSSFFRLVLTGFIIGAPVAWIAVEWYLQQYAYRTTIGVGIFFVAGAIATTLALVTMAYQSFQAARSNPVNALRGE